MSQLETNKKKVFAERLRGLIREYKKTHGKFSQQVLADYIPVARETISYWLNEKSYPGDDSIKRICEFFAAPPNYFDKSHYEDGWTMFDQRTHDNLQKQAEEYANHIGLSHGLYAFIKETPALADLVVGSSWIDATLQSCNPDVPSLPDHTFQIEGRAGVKIYPPNEVLYMLRVVQRDLSEYALFLIQKWSRIIHEAHKDEMSRGEITRDSDGYRDSSGKEYMSAIARYELELYGRDCLTPGSYKMANMYKLLSPDGQAVMYKAAKDAYNECRKTDKKAQKFRRAIKKAMETHTVVPSADEIMNEKED